jgi:hypothetical protein
MSNWHLDTDIAERYTEGRIGDVFAASIEQHVLDCDACRALLRLEPARADRVWTEIIEQVQAPRPTLVERGLHRLGVRGTTARVIAATPTLRGSWLAGIVLVLAVALYVAHATPRGTFFFFVLAPVLPLLGVASAFGPDVDPTHEIAAASPYSTMRLLVARTSFVVTTTLVPAVAAAFFLPGDHWLAVAWLLPSLALTTVALAAAGRFPVRQSALALSGLWVALCFSRAMLRGTGTGASAREAQGLQLVSLIVLAIAAWFIATRPQDLAEQLRRNP